MVTELLLDQHPILTWLFMFAILLLVTELSYRFGRRRSKDSPVSDKHERGVGIIASAMLGLLAFMLAISLSMADGRFDYRRKLILEEANAIGTAHLRAQTIGGPHGAQIMRLLRDYTKLRLDFFAAGEDQKRLKTIYEQTAIVQQEIWEHVSAVAGLSPTPITGILLQSLNQVFDLATAGRWGLEVRVPLHVIRLLYLFSLLSAGMMGYYLSLSGYRHLILSSLLLFAFAAAMMLITDLNKPRSGYIRAEQSALIWTFESLKGNRHEMNH